MLDPILTMLFATAIYTMIILFILSTPKSSCSMHATVRYLC
jgi:hypothetical protein